MENGNLHKGCDKSGFHCTGVNSAWILIIFWGQLVYITMYRVLQVLIEYLHN